MSDAEPAKPDLEFITTDDLLDELERRHDAIVVLREARRDADVRHTSLHWAGSLNACIGLAHRALDGMMRDGEENESPEPSDE